MDLNLLLAGCAVALGGLVRGFAGFGAAMIMVPLLSWLYSPIEAVVTCALLELVGFLPLLSSVTRHSRWPNVRPMAMVSLLSVPIGAWLLVTLDPILVRRVFSIIVLTFVGVLATGWRYEGRASLPVTMSVGGLSGTLAGLANMGGPPVVLFFLSRKDRAVEIRASILALLMAQTFLALAVYFLRGLVTHEVFLRCLVWAPFYVAALWIGGHLFGFSSEDGYRRMALVILAIIGLATLLN